MIDLTHQNIGFRGYSIVGISESAYRAIANVDSGVPVDKILLLTLDRMIDTAGPDEPSGWLFEAKLPAGGRVWLERSGGLRDERGHHGGHWTMFLPEER